MASSAISAQGTTLQIGTGSGGALTVTAISKEFRAKVTSAAHGRVKGDSVTFAAVVGMVEINGLTGIVVNVVDANNFNVNIDSNAFTAYTSGGTATPVTWTAIKNMKDFAGFDGSSSELDKTNLDSTAKEFMLGLTDPGQLTINLDQDNADAGQIAVRAALVSGAAKSFKFTLPNGNTASFTAYVKKFDAKGGVDAIVKSSIAIRISGAITWA